MSIKASSAKAKGRELQKLVCRKISKLLNLSYDQSDDNCLIHSREMGQAGSDVVLRGEAFNRFPFDIECKRTEKLNIYKAIKQGKVNTKKGRNYLVVHKKNRTDPIAILDLDVFMKILKKLEDLKGNEIIDKEISTKKL